MGSPLGLRVVANASSKNKAVRVPPEMEPFVLQYARMRQRDHPLTRDPAFRRRFSEDLKSLAKTPASGVVFDADALDAQWASILRQEADGTSATTASKKKDGSDASVVVPAIAKVDGEPFVMSKNMVDRPGIFVGRDGRHPLNGRIRRPIQEEDVVLNLSRGAPVPAPRAGHAWKHIVHDPLVNWLVRWEDPLTGAQKYVYLDVAARSRQHHDENKFDKAREYKRRRPAIARVLRKDMTSPDAPEKVRQLAACAALIEEFGIRVGNDEQRKGRGDGVVGATSLRRKNVRVLSPKMDECVVELDFVGKDNVRFFMRRRVPDTLYRVIERLLSSTHGAGEDALVFDEVTPEALNAYLDALMPGLTGKVLRTYVASDLIDGRLRDATSRAGAPKTGRGDVNASAKKGLPFDAKLLSDVALCEVAWRLNHRRDVGGDDVRRRNADGRGDRNRSNGKGHGTKHVDVPFSDAVSRVWRAAAAAKTADVAKAVEGAAKEAKKKAAEMRLSPGTAKTNYIDPRVLVAYAKRANLELRKTYTPSQHAKFAWAVDAPPNFVF